MPSVDSDFAAHVVTALQRDLPAVMRWAGAIARQLRQHNIALEGKSSGSRETDALTLADLTVQELLVGALRDSDPVFRRCRIEAEESTGDLNAFTPDSPVTIALDPIDGTKQFRDHTGNGYAVMSHVRTAETVIGSLIFVPEMGPHGTWVQAFGDTVKSGPDDPQRPAGEVLAGLPNITRDTRRPSNRIYLIGFQQHDRARAAMVTALGLQGVPPDDMPGSVYPLLATGEFAGSLIHSPNIYDFPVSLHLARVFGGDAVWVHSGEPVHFRETWMDDRADMLRLPGIVACAIDDEVRLQLCELARDWNPVRYPGE
ncbi:MAG: inositol monophosphatase [Planctomycetaceae bacterium]|nr:inositol monophosphatase [Planctomycetaceae bacterium]